ncbi:hypothetical protein [Crossiella sp. CA198]|uniref:hypothetical protein n=1 Tax=Crossiella sp. CA198 TaxID=3455607 RepID=UPI003F8CF67B
MRKLRIIPLVAASILAAGAPPEAAPTAPLHRHLAQVIVCEYVVKGIGAPTFASSQFDITEPSGHLQGGTVVWGDRRGFVNRRYPNEPLTVRELSGSGGKWALAITLAKTPAKCLPL